MSSYKGFVSNELQINWERDAQPYRQRQLVPSLVKSVIKDRIAEEGLSDQDEYLLNHVVGCLFNPDAANKVTPTKVVGESIAVPFEYRRKAFPNADIQYLEGVAILSCDYKKAEGKCFYFRLIDPRIQEAMALVTESKDFSLSSVLESKRSRYSVDNTDTNIITEAKKGIAFGLMNEDAVRNYLTKERSDLIFLDEYMTGSKRDLRFRGDMRYLCGILERIKDSRYEQRYSTQTVGGRILALSGDQMLSREVKALAFGLPGVKNYDVVKAHLAALLALTPEPTDFLFNLVTNSDEVVSQLVWLLGVEKAQIKTAQLALAYGAADRMREGLAVFDALGRDRAIMREFILCHQGLIKSRNAYVRFLMTDRKTKEGRYTNAVGLELPKELRDKPKTVLSHMLTGVEGKFILPLCSAKMQRSYGYQALSNQFDGLASLGDIPKEAVDKAKEGLPNPDLFKLVEKPFC